MKQYIVDAFTNNVFSGNPAAVCVMEQWPAEETMKKIAAENNLSETAFIVKEREGYHLRWFTPGTEVEICGHATLASAFVILNYYDVDADEVIFHTMSGKLTVNRKENFYEMNFPTYELKEIPVTDAMEEAFGARPVKAVLGLDLLCIFENEEIVRTMEPKQELLLNIEGRIQNATARGSETDCVSRSFCPKIAILEDPVCGSAHCQIADYWAKVLGKKDIVAYQASKRGGTLYCHFTEDKRVIIGGEAVLFSAAEINVKNDGMTWNNDRLEWIRKPAECTVSSDKIEIVTEPHTDLWQRTYYHFRNDNAPVLQMRTEEKYFSFTVKTDFSGSGHRFDQCGIVLYLDSENWLKASVEYENERFQHLGSVVTNNGYSDWATTEIDTSVKFMWYRLSRREDDFCIECSDDGKVFHQMRVCHMWKAKQEVSFGIYACSPEDSSFKAVFCDMELTECKWLAHDGQAPDEN